jgi:hypothetical protein
MHVTFHKINPKEYKLHIKREDGSEDEVVLNYREFLKHDLIHFVLEKNGGLRESFFGQIAKGKALADFSPKAMKESNEGFEGELVVTEIMVGSFQGALKSGDLGAESLAEYIRLQGHKVPKFLDDSFILSVLREVKGLIKRYDEMKVGESLEMEFFENEPAKSYCGDPKSMANIFGKLNQLGK